MRGMKQKSNIWYMLGDAWLTCITSTFENPSARHVRRPPAWYLRVLGLISTVDRRAL